MKKRVIIGLVCGVLTGVAGYVVAKIITANTFQLDDFSDLEDNSSDEDEDEDIFSDFE